MTWTVFCVTQTSHVLISKIQLTIKKKIVNQFRLPYEILTVTNKTVFYPVTLLNSKC